MGVKLALGAALAAAGAGLALGIVMSDGRVKKAQAQADRIQAAWDKQNLDRAEAALKVVSDDLLRIQKHGADTQENVDEYQMSEMVRDVVHRSELAAADRLRIDAERRAATYRAQAIAGAAACSDLADRHAALDAHVVRGTEVVAGLRGDLARRDGEVRLLRNQIDIDRAACGGETWR